MDFRQCSSSPRIAAFRRAVTPEPADLAKAAAEGADWEGGAAAGWGTAGAAAAGASAEAGAGVTGAAGEGVMAVAGAGVKAAAEEGATRLRPASGPTRRPVVDHSSGQTACTTDRA